MFKSMIEYFYMEFQEVPMKSSKHLHLMIAFITVLFGEIYLRPFYTDFRFSLGVCALGILLLIYETSFRTVLVTGMSILIFRVWLAMNLSTPFDLAVMTHLPGALYYIFYGSILLASKVRYRLNHPLLALTVLLVADVTSNILELMIRGQFHDLTSSFKLQALLLTAIIRGILILSVYLLARFYPTMFQKEEEKKKISSWIVAQSKLYAEVVFLKKSEGDIEKAMTKAHGLYTSIQAHKTVLPPEWTDMPRKVLSITRDIHEIKKDYRRINEALRALIPDNLPASVPTPAELTDFLCDDIEVWAHSNGKNIKITRVLSPALSDQNLFDYLSLLNNLLTNAVDAIDHSGEINLTVNISNGLCEISIKDNGRGIPDEDLSMIFEPGYSTNYDPKTGHMSTGIGLAQVQYIVNHLLKGHISVNSKLGSGTLVRITYPLLT
jgi:two-component system sensor histidine kinase YcbA